MSTFPASGYERAQSQDQLAVGSRQGLIPLSCVGPFQKKTKQNQSRVLVMVPRGGIWGLPLSNSLVCPTYHYRPVEPQ